MKKNPTITITVTDYGREVKGVLKPENLDGYSFTDSLLLATFTTVLSSIQKGLKLATKRKFRTKMKTLLNSYIILYYDRNDKK